ncbi:MAG: shikimate kinase [Bacteroidales bacterium]|jgi:shikimate kinase
MREFRNIALTGFMATGKSTVGRELAVILGWDFTDTDEEIAAKAGMSVQQIFETKGECFFRKIEEEVIQKVNQSEKCVISCGGGAILSEKNRLLLRENCYTIWLYNSVETTIERNENKCRPLLSCSNPLEKAIRLYKEREPLYAGSCDCSMCTEMLSPTEIASMLTRHISVM